MSLRLAHGTVFDGEGASRVADPSLSVLILSCAWGIIDLRSSGPASVRLLPSWAIAAVSICHRHRRVSPVSGVRCVSGCTDVARRRKVRNFEHFDTQPDTSRPAQPGSYELWRRNRGIATRATGRSVDAAGEGKHLRGLPHFADVGIPPSARSFSDRHVMPNIPSSV